MRLSQTHLWGLAGLLARIAPVSMVPLLIRFYAPAEVDWFVLVQTNAALLAVIIAFSQANFIQQNYSEENKSELIVFTSIVPIGIFAAMALAAYLFISDFKIYFYSLLLGLFMSYVAQSQAVLRCAGLYSSSIVADFLRLAIFGIFAAVLFLYSALPLEVAVLMMAAYYFLPYLVFAMKVIKKISVGDIPRIWRAMLPYLTTVVFSVLLSAAALAGLRYILFNYGQPGDLAAYAAIYSVASLSVVVVDFIYIRLGQNIVVGARERNNAALTAIARRIGPPVIVVSVVSLLVTSGYALIQLPRSDGSTLLVAVILVGNFVLRAIYIFFQNILIGLKTARLDFLAAGIALALVGVAGPYIIGWWPLVGTALTLLLVSVSYIITLGSVVLRLKNQPESA